MMSEVLGVAVSQHDDGSRPGMHDLDILHPDRPHGAAEVTAAADGECLALWRLMNGNDERWIVPELDGGWLVSLDPAARAKSVRKELPGLLLELERSRTSCLSRRSRFDRHDLASVADGLGVVSAEQSGTDFPGSIYITLDLPAERSGGMVAITGEPLAQWISSFLKDGGRRDVRQKLARSGADERHAFVVMPGFTTAPFIVSDLLMRDGASLPVEYPELPGEVTDVWAVSTWSSGAGFRWSPQAGWSTFPKSTAR
jgi:hypothetical protein